MSFYFRLLRGGSVFVEYASWATLDGFIHSRWENRELVLWLGRWHFIYTPPRWSPLTGGYADGRVRPL